MAIIEREINKSMVADKEELRQMMAEQNEKMGFVRVPGATAQKARETMQSAGVRPEDNEATSELMRMRYGSEHLKG